MQSSLSIYSQDEVTNEDVTVTYTPSSEVTNYEYIIIKDANSSDPVIVKGNKISNILLSESGTYQIKIIEYYGSISKKILSGNYKIDKESPQINLDKQELNLTKGENFDVMDGVTAQDNFDGDITSNIITNEKDIDLTKIGKHKLTYTVSDEAGNEVMKTMIVNIKPDHAKQLFIAQGFILLALIIIIIYMLKYSRSLKIEKRVSRYTVKSIKDHSRTIFGNICIFIDLIISKIAKIIDKSVFINKIGKRYEKYVKTFGKETDKVTVIIAQKLLMSIAFLLIAVIAKTIRLQVLQIYEIIFPLFIGYYTLDIIYEYRYRLYRRRIENDFLQAIIILNNAFKSGRSISQAIELVSVELDGPLSEEFKKMALEMSFGLDIDVVFGRFSERIKLEEATYLTASLSITNKTGGNIIRVFDSIEKTLFNRKKLKLELKSLTGSSKIIMYALMIIPFFFVVIISMIDPTYFAPLFVTPLGLLLILIMIIIYITYVIVVRKIINIRM